MSQGREPSSIVIQAASKMVFPSNAKLRVANEIIAVARRTSNPVQAVQLSLQQAAHAAYLPTTDLLFLLKGDPVCFKLVQSSRAGPAQYAVRLNVAAVVSKAKAATSTGILLEELPPPKAFVHGKHPLRPGQPDCKQFVKLGECAYNERCVFNHPGKPSAVQHKQQSADQQPRWATPLISLAPAPPPKHPAWGRTRVADAVAGGAVAAGGSNNDNSTSNYSSASNNSSTSANTSSSQLLLTAGASAEAANHGNSLPSTLQAASHSNSLPSTPGAVSHCNSLHSTPAAAHHGNSLPSTLQAASHSNSLPSTPEAANHGNSLPSMPGAASNSNSLPSTPGRQPDAVQTQTNDQQEAPSQQQQQHPAPQQQPQPAQVQQQQPQQQRLPPGFGPQHFKSRLCQLMTLRGFCPMGDRCPYDHPARPGASSLTAVAAADQQPVSYVSTAAMQSATQAAFLSHVAAAAQQPVPYITISMAAALSAAQADSLSHVAADQQPVPYTGISTGATQSATRADTVSPLAATAEPVTPEALAVTAAEAPAPATAWAGSSDTTGPPAAAGSSSAPPAHRTFKELLAGPQAPPPPQQQQQLNEPQQQEQAQQAAAAAGVQDNGKLLLGWTDGCLPQLRGAPNCHLYMARGHCKYKERCVYNHPPEAEHPEGVMHGKPPVRFNPKNHACYARMVSHLYRLYDYDSCVEAQLKIWLAKHLLSKNNADVHMFSSSASKPITVPHGRGFWWQRLGPYTCSLGEAGEVLHNIWREQPDAASQQPFPYTKKLRELLNGDPYFTITVDPDCSNHFWVKLEVAKIKSMLNF